MLNQKIKAIRWSRYSRTPFASFQSLHREVIIGVLAVAMLQSVGLKAKAGGLADFARLERPETNEDSGDGNHDGIAADTLLLEAVEVFATRVPLAGVQAPRLVTVLSQAEIQAAAVHSINDLLEYSAGVDVRQRGEFGVQTDISVRGGTFDQITILLNGISISSPQTGHHSADFPVAVQDIERIEILEGPSARVFGTSAFTGVINVVTKSEKGGAARLVGGSYGLAEADLRYKFLSGGFSRSDGATPNSDFLSYRAFLKKDFTKKDRRIDVQTGYSYKRYGANTFYGAASTDQWESNERYLSSLTYENKIGERLHVAASASWNRWFDHYQWHRGNPAGENFHRVDALDGTMNVWFENRFGKTSFGIETRYEGIYSTKLGEELAESKWKPTGGHDAVKDVRYSHHADRTNISAFVEHDILLNDWTASFGALMTHNSALGEKWRFYPGVDVSYRPNENWRLYLSWNMALRMPTFTDLYYSGTNIIGTKKLKPERTNDLSLGSRFRRKGWKAEASIFYSHKSDMIDWVIYSDEPDRSTFRSGNFSLDNIGTELTLDFLPRELFPQAAIRKIGVQYAYINEDIRYEKEILASKYAMEFLRHKIVLTGEAKLWKNLNFSLSWRWQDRTGKYNNPYSLLDVRFVYFLHRFSAYVDCSNLLNKKYCDYSFIPQPGRWAKLGISVEF